VCTEKVPWSCLEIAIRVHRLVGENYLVG
jgi:hypothetical protein